MKKSYFLVVAMIFPMLFSEPLFGESRKTVAYKCWNNGHGYMANQDEFKRLEEIIGKGKNCKKIVKIKDYGRNSKQWEDGYDGVCLCYY